MCVDLLVCMVVDFQYLCDCLWILVGECIVYVQEVVCIECDVVVQQVCVVVELCGGYVWIEFGLCIDLVVCECGVVVWML